jgi:two-component system chemotaxis response regulator CheY
LARKILLADDSVTAQNMGRKILADAGYEVITVNNGSAALKKIAEQKPDLIVLDVYMPGYSGLEVCQRLKDAQETARVPVLLTVGKLEPFKPEEARRARADGFIVKPFEASELLSALSKLEDKIVPRSESKPGRFARANAALDEARYDKTVAVEEDSSWKNRIAFPKKKSEPAPEENDDSAFYNPMNKDLRTVVERKADKPFEAEARVDEPRVDLGALAPEGLPKDVTPEEIAALAAAAAQVKGKIADAGVTEEKLAEEKFAESRFVEPPIPARTEQPAPAPEPIQAAPAIPQEVAVAAPPAVTFAAQKPEEKFEEKAEQTLAAKLEAAVEKPAEAASIAAPSIGAPSHADLMAAITALEPEPAAAAGSGSPDQASANSGSAGSGNSSWLQAGADRSDEPVTMAVAAGMAESSLAASRWSAVAVALAPEEAAISLEQEMQKAYAAFAAADSGQAAASTTIPDTQPQQAPYTEISRTETSQTGTSQSETSQIQPVPVLLAAAVETPVEEVEQTLSAAASVATDAISAAVQELEAVAAAYAKEMKPALSASDAPTAEFKVPASPLPEASQTTAASVSASTETIVEANTDKSPVVAAAVPALEIPLVESARPEALQSELEERNQRIKQLSQQEIEEPKIEEAKAETKIEETKIAESKIEEVKIQEAKIEEIKPEEVKPEEAKSEVAAPVVTAVAAVEPASSATAPVPEIAPTPVAEVAAEQIAAELGSVTPVSSPAIASEIDSAKFSSSSIFSSDLISSGAVSSELAAALYESATGGISDMAKKESEIAANTAAAWASWRRIRETDPKAAAPAGEPLKEESAPQDAAMAVAAGAEKAPEEAREAGEPDEIASIVDSVLADLRPKIVEEISRKMGKKK